MLSYHLQNALKDLEELIELTKFDIEDIKQAKHDEQFERLSLKDEKIKSFEAKKAMIDRDISNLMSENPDKDLTQLITDQQHELLDEFKQKLLDLKDINQRYAKLVLSVSTLYNKFLEELVPTEMQGYKKVASKDPNFIQVRV